jgi:transposase
MKIELSKEEKEKLEREHKKTRDRRIADRIKAVLLHSEGWSQLQISQALRIRAETVHDHLEDYRQSKKLKPENGGSDSLLSNEQTTSLITHLEAVTYLRVEEICAYVEQTYRIKFTVSGMTKWLRRHNFSYKKPKGRPAKADPEKQTEFIKFYETLLNTVGEDEPIEFGDGVHPTMATKIAYGWIRKGHKHEKSLSTTASRTRMNLMGSINLETMEITIGSYQTIDSLAMKEHFKKLRQKYPKFSRIHLILDQGPYNTSEDTKGAASKYGIILHYLPPYSPNLNPIERVWKVMNERARNNRFFSSANEFRKAITDFFEVTWPQIAQNMVDRINDNFSIVKQAS